MYAAYRDSTGRLFVGRTPVDVRDGDVTRLSIAISSGGTLETQVVIEGSADPPIRLDSLQLEPRKTDTTPISIPTGQRFDAAGRVVLDQSTGGFVAAFDTKTGKQMWRTAREATVGWGTPIAIRVVTRTHLVWSSPRGSPFIPSPIRYREHLYIVNDMQSIVTALEATSGNTAWQERLGVARREGFSASPVAMGGKVFFTNDEGETFVLRAGGKYELLHVNNIGERTLASPALVDGRWYLRTEGHLIAVGTR